MSISLKSTILLPQQSFELYLPILPFDHTQLGNGWGIYPSQWGCPHSYGVVGFVGALAKAVLMPKADALNFLFPTKGSYLAANNEDVRRAARCHERIPASPHLGWSLFREHDQKTLRFLNDVFGLTWMDFPHQPLYQHREGEDDLVDEIYTFFCFRYGYKGMWSWGAYPIDGPRDDDYRMVVF